MMTGKKNHTSRFDYETLSNNSRMLSRNFILLNDVGGYRINNFEKHGSVESVITAINC